MTCQRMDRVIAAAVEDAAPPPEHVRECQLCRQYWDDLRALRSELATWPREVSTEVDHDAIRARVMRRLATGSPWGASLRWATLAAVLIGVAAGVWIFRPIAPPPTLSARIDVPAPPAGALLPPLKPRPRTETRPRRSTAARTRVPTPEIKVAAMILPADGENSSGGGLLKLESENPKVILYLMTDNVGD